MPKGVRYAEGVREAVRREIEEELPFFSYRTARAWYRTVVKHLSRKEVAYLAANDRFFLLTSILRRKDADTQWVYERAREVEANPDGHLDLWARYHYKSTIITFAGSFQEIIDNPETTIAIFGYDLGVSRPFLEQIKRECEENDLLTYYFPDVFYVDPRKQSPRWSMSEGIIVRRRTNPKEATVTAFGLMEGLPTGGHWSLLIFNDVVTLKSVTQTESNQVKKTWLHWEQAQNLGTHEKMRRWIEGTRYHFADAYGTMLRQKSAIPRVYPATHDGTMNGRPVFLSAEKWDEIKRDQRMTLAAQQLLNPLAGEESTFLIDWLRHYELRPAILTVWIIVDPAQKRSDTSDRTAMIVVGMDAARNFYLLDGYCHRMKLSEKTEKLIELDRKWRGAPGVQMVRIGYERYGMQTDVEHIELETQRRQIQNMSIEEVNWVRDGPQAKSMRIRRMEPDFRNSRFWLPKYVWIRGVGKCTWYVEWRTEPRLDAEGAHVLDKMTGKPVMDVVKGSAEIVHVPYRGPTKAEAVAANDGEHFRILDPIRRLDEDGNVYDLTSTFMEEYRLHPFGAHEDTLDAASRVYDLDPMPPMATDLVSHTERPSPDD